MSSVAGGSLVRVLDRASIAVALLATAYHFLTVWAVPHGATRHYTVHLALMLVLVGLATARRRVDAGPAPGKTRAAGIVIFLLLALALTVFLYVEDSRLEMTQPWARLGTLYSAAYFAAPVTLARPSTRLVGLPMCAVVMRVARAGRFGSSGTRS